MTRTANDVLMTVQDLTVEIDSTDDAVSSWLRCAVAATSLSPSCACTRLASCVEQHCSCWTRAEQMCDLEVVGEWRTDALQ